MSHLLASPANAKTIEKLPSILLTFLLGEVCTSPRKGQKKFPFLQIERTVLMAWTEEAPAKFWLTNHPSHQWNQNNVIITNMKAFLQLFLLGIPQATEILLRCTTLQTHLWIICHEKYPPKNGSRRPLRLLWKLAWSSLYYSYWQSFSTQCFLTLSLQLEMMSKNWKLWCVTFKILRWPMMIMLENKDVVIEYKSLKCQKKYE